MILMIDKDSVTFYSENINKYSGLKLKINSQKCITMLLTARLDSVHDFSSSSPILLKVSLICPITTISPYVRYVNIAIQIGVSSNVSLLGLRPPENS